MGDSDKENPDLKNKLAVYLDNSVPPAEASERIGKPPYFKPLSDEEEKPLEDIRPLLDTLSEQGIRRVGRHPRSGVFSFVFGLANHRVLRICDHNDMRQRIYDEPPPMLLKPLTRIDHKKLIGEIRPAVQVHSVGSPYAVILAYLSAACGYMFNDAKTDNVGLLKNGRPIIFDPGALKDVGKMLRGCIDLPQDYPLRDMMVSTNMQRFDVVWRDYNKRLSILGMSPYIPGRDPEALSPIRHSYFPNIHEYLHVPPDPKMRNEDMYRKLCQDQFEKFEFTPEQRESLRHGVELFNKLLAVAKVPKDMHFSDKQAAAIRQLLSELQPVAQKNREFLQALYDKWQDDHCRALGIPQESHKQGLPDHRIDRTFNTQKAEAPLRDSRLARLLRDNKWMDEDVLGLLCEIAAQEFAEPKEPQKPGEPVKDWVTWIEEKVGSIKTQRGF